MTALAIRCTKVLGDFNFAFYSSILSLTSVYSPTHCRCEGHCCNCSHSVTHTRSVGLSTTDRPVAQTSTWQHATFSRDRQTSPWRDSKLQPPKASGRRTMP